MTPRRVGKLVGAVCICMVLFGTASASAASFFAQTAGKEEVPGPGDPNAFGGALIDVRPATDEVCIGVRFRNMDPPNLMHIHAGAKGVGGPIVVNLTSTLDGNPRCVTDADADAISAAPSQYYLNLHNTPFPAGATRGQLERSQVPSAFGVVRGPLFKFTRMTGTQEVPGPGDPNGRGVSFIDLNPTLGRVCIDVRYRNLAPPDLMHIHDGAKGVAGPIVVNLTDTLDGSPRCVTGVDPALVTDIRDNPLEYYCNIHNGDFPAGAIRGQLETSK
jgi:hypothetical protein